MSRAHHYFSQAGSVVYKYKRQTGGVVNVRSSF